MRPLSMVLCIAVVLAGIPGVAVAQSVISAKSGLVNYTMGKVLLDGKEVELKFGNFPQINQNSELRALEGRAEVLLSPGVFLRLGENSALRMLSNRLTDTRVELLSGSIILECADLLKGDEVMVTHRNANVALLRNRVYRLDSDPEQLRVYDGEARVEQAGQIQVVKKGKLLPLNGVSVAEKFDTRTGDSLFRWARRRAEDIAVANVSAAKYANERGGITSSCWYWNPYFGFYTFLPYSGMYRSFWGYRLWSPGAVYMVYAPPAMTRSADMGTYNPHLGYSTMPQTSAGTSGTVAASAPPTAASSAPSAPISRESGQAGGRQR